MPPAPLTDADARAILAHYDLGRLEAFEELPVRAHNAPYYRLTTTRGAYFLKRYRDFTPNVDRGLDLIVTLRAQGYPAIQVLTTVKGEPHVTHGGAVIALFEYLDTPDDRTLNATRAAALGDALGRLHTLGGVSDLPRSFAGYQHFTQRLSRLPDWPWLPAEAAATLAWVRAIFPELAAPPDQPLGPCHVEFVMEHARFVGDRLHRIIDWDLVGTDCLFHDLGTTLSEAVHPDHVDFPSLSSIVNAYAAHRPLSDWERDHLYEATCFGRGKFLLWSLGRETLGPASLPHNSFRKVETLRTLGKRQFDRLLADHGAVRTRPRHAPGG